MIVDDNAEFSAAARTILEGPDVAVVGEAATAAQALELAAKLDPDLVLVDIDLGDDSGFAVTRQLAGRAESSTPKVILISTHPEDEFADLITESPALGFIAKAELSPVTLGELLSTT